MKKQANNYNYIKSIKVIRKCRPTSEQAYIKSHRLTDTAKTKKGNPHFRRHYKCYHRTKIHGRRTMYLGWVLFEEKTRSQNFNIGKSSAFSNTEDSKLFPDTSRATSSSILESRVSVDQRIARGLLSLDFSAKSRALGGGGECWRQISESYVG